MWTRLYRSGQWKCFPGGGSDGVEKNTREGQCYAPIQGVTDVQEPMLAVEGRFVIRRVTCSLVDLNVHSYQ